MAKRVKPALSAEKGADSGPEGSARAAAEESLRAASIFPTAEEFDAAAARYFDACDADERLYGEAGLCLALSRHNAGGRTVTLRTLRGWYDGDSCTWLQDSVQRAYLRIQEQIETDPRYREKGYMVSRALFLQKQSRFGGYQDRQESKNDSSVRILFGDGVDESDFK